MTWSDMTQNWSEWFDRLKGRFPRIDDGAMAYLKQDRERFEAHVAATHDLTLGEAREQFEQFLYIETLARGTADIRAGS